MISFADLPRHMFPVLIEALHPMTRATVWSQRVNAPRTDSEKELVYVPPLAKQLGHRVIIRITYGDGTVVEEDVITKPKVH